MKTRALDLTLAENGTKVVERGVNNEEADTGNMVKGLCVSLQDKKMSSPCCWHSVLHPFLSLLSIHSLSLSEFLFGAH